MLNLLLFVVATIGLTNILVESQIAKPLRDFYDWLMQYTPQWFQDWLGGLFTCHQCCGFWAGMICGSILLVDGFWLVVLTGCAGSFLAAASALLFECVMYGRDFIMSQTPVQMPPEEPNE